MGARGKRVPPAAACPGGNAGARPGRVASMRPTVLATLPLDARRLALVAGALAPVAEVVHLPALAPHERADALRNAAALLARHTGKELLAGEAALVRTARLVQFVNAGLDFVPLHDFAPTVPLAGNNGAYGRPIAEHAMGMCLAAAKRLIVEDAAMRRGEFNQSRPNKELAGAVCGIVGLGGIGGAIAHLARAFGMQVHGVCRSGESRIQLDWTGRTADLPAMLAAADVLMLCMPLTPETRGVIGAAELARMKPDAILVNVARGEVIDEEALYAHLRAHPHFTACIDAWWVEPSRHGRFELRCPFFELPNVIASPHNAAAVPSALDAALEQASANIRRALRGEQPLNLVSPEERRGGAPLEC